VNSASGSAAGSNNSSRAASGISLVGLGTAQPHNLHHHHHQAAGASGGVGSREQKPRLRRSITSITLGGSTATTGPTITKEVLLDTRPPSGVHTTTANSSNNTMTMVPRSRGSLPIAVTTTGGNSGTNSTTTTATTTTLGSNSNPSANQISILSPLTTVTSNGSQRRLSSITNMSSLHQQQPTTVSKVRTSLSSSCLSTLSFGNGTSNGNSNSSSSSTATSNHHTNHASTNGSTSTLGNGTSSSTPASTTNTPVAKPLSPSLFQHRLNAFERQEIVHYPEVWYVGLDSHKVVGDPDNLSHNHGYDDDNGSYIKVLHDHIAYRYEILEVIGKGSFGQVIKALDHKTHQEVALKIIRNKKRFHQQALVEVKILEHLSKSSRDGSQYVVQMLDYFYFRNHLCITFELMGCNLYELIKKNNYQGFSLNLIRKFAYSLVSCLRLLYRENIIHCDLKPENILLKAKGSSSIKVIDFGSSCFSHQRIYTYIQSRFYRSPEVILGLPYGTPIDIWSLGCILAELYTGYPLFPGENEADQLSCIMEVLNLPPSSVLECATRRRLFFGMYLFPAPLPPPLSLSLIQLFDTRFKIR